MIKRVSVTNFKGERLDMELTNPYASGLAVVSIEGLGPSKATINTTEVVNSDGSFFNTAKIENRNLVLTLVLFPCPTIEAARLKTYQYFPAKKKLTLEVETDSRIAKIDGYVESNEPSIFSEMESTSISIICPNPYFSSVESSETMFAGIDPAFEFPFENFNGSTPFSNNIILSNYLVRREADVYYDGDADAGCLIRIHALGPATNIRIYNADTREFIGINTSVITTITGQALKLADDILISTHKGNKYLQLLRNGVYTNILNALAANSTWIQLKRGHNLIAYTADSGIYNLQFSVTNSVLYEGM